MTKTNSLKGALDTNRALCLSGYNSFVESVSFFGSINADDAKKVVTFYIKNKIAKQDFIGGRISVKHGAFLDKETIARALTEAA